MSVTRPQTKCPLPRADDGNAVDAKVGHRAGDLLQRVVWQARHHSRMHDPCDCGGREVGRADQRAGGSGGAPAVGVEHALEVVALEGDADRAVGGLSGGLLFVPRAQMAHALDTVAGALPLT